MRGASRSLFLSVDIRSEDFGVSGTQHQLVPSAVSLLSRSLVFQSLFLFLLFLRYGYASSVSLSLSLSLPLPRFPRAHEVFGFVAVVSFPSCSFSDVNR